MAETGFTGGDGGVHGYLYEWKKLVVGFLEVISEEIDESEVEDVKTLF